MYLYIFVLSLVVSAEETVIMDQSADLFAKIISQSDASVLT